jgi:hypothetical protein
VLHNDRAAGPLRVHEETLTPIFVVEILSLNSPNLDTLFTPLLTLHTTLIRESVPKGVIGKSTGAEVTRIKLSPLRRS